MHTEINNKKIDRYLERGDYISQAREWEEIERKAWRKKLLLKLFWGAIYFVLILFLLVSI